MKPQHIINLIMSIFGLIGIALLIGGGFWLGSNIRYNQTAEPVTAVITSIETRRDSDGDIDYDVYVSYTYDGERYEDIWLNFWSSGMSEGENMTLYCNPGDPTSPHSPSSDYLGGALLLFMGLCFFLVGLCNWINFFKKKKRKKMVLENGIHILATVDDISVDTSLRVNGNSPFVISCYYEDEYTGTTYEFVSEQFWDCPEEVFPMGSTIDVTVDPNDYSNYHVNAEEKMAWRFDNHN